MIAGLDDEVPAFGYVTERGRTATYQRRRLRRSGRCWRRCYLGRRRRRNLGCRRRSNGIAIIIKDILSSGGPIKRRHAVGCAIGIKRRNDVTPFKSGGLCSRIPNAKSRMAEMSMCSIDGKNRNRDRVIRVLFRIRTMAKRDLWFGGRLGGGRRTRSHVDDYPICTMARFAAILIPVRPNNVVASCRDGVRPICNACPCQGRGIGTPRIDIGRLVGRSATDRDGAAGRCRRMSKNDAWNHKKRHKRDRHGKRRHRTHLPSSVR